MNHKVTKGFFALLLIVGAGIFLYPRVSGYVEHIRQARVIEAYHEAGSSITDEIYEKELARAQAYNRKLADEMDFDHAVAAARGHYSDEYNVLLDTGINGVMGSICIPKIDVELPVYHGTEEKDLARGVGHYEGTSLPVGGESTHAVLSGHRGLPSADLFTRLDEVETGDYFVINTLGRELTYRVDQIKTVLPEDTEELGIVQGRDYVTLVTCTPYGINSHRLLIRGSRTENQPEPEEGTADDETAVMSRINRELKELLEYSAVVLVVLLLTAVLIWKNRNRKV
ncbi:MAG: class C sortase [Eubacteriales bacterium]|nr:class C sortase [Eubacteriales bacterium]